MSVLDTINLNGTEYSLAGSGGSNSEYKTVTLHTITLEPSIVLDNTRVLSNTRSTVNGYKTYLIDMSQITQPLVLTSSLDDGKWSCWGYYVYDSTTDEYTWSNINSGLTMMYNRSGYSGIFVSTNSADVIFDFYTGIDVVTNNGYECGRKGFRSVECEHMPFAPSGDSYFKVIFPINKTNAYIIDVGNAEFAAIKQSVNNQTIISTTNNISSTPTKKILFANMKNRQAYIEVRASQQGSWRTLCQRGLYLYELTKPEEIVQCRNKNYINVLAHGLNNFDDLILSMANGWSGGEFDIRKTSDGVYVFSHEPALNGMTIATTTYDVLSSGYVRVYTLDELLEFTSPFDIWYEFDFKTGSVLDVPYLFRRLLKHTNKVGYWGGSVQGMEPPYKNGWPVYDFGGSPPTNDDDISVYQWYVGGSDLDRTKPYKYFAADNPGTVTLADIKAGTYDGYAFIQPYFSGNKEQEYLSDD